MAEQHSWFETASRRKRWLVGVSGGADSVALLHLLIEHRFRDLVVCHLDHRLRGRASTEDARFVKRLAARLGVVCEAGRTEVERLRNEEGGSMETAARVARQRFFAACAVRYRCRRVLLAHHADDQAETVLWNLLRGSHGLKGMGEGQTIRVESGQVLELTRPLLAWRRAQLRDWLRARGLSWREDATNAEAVAVRNRLRHEAIPLLEEIAGKDVTASLLRAEAGARQDREIVRWALQQAKVCDPQERLHLPALRGLPRELQRAALESYLRKQGIPGLDRALIDRCAGLIEGAAGAPSCVNLPGGGHLRRRAGRLWVEPAGALRPGC